MELTVKDRLILLNVLMGITSGITEIRILRELRENLSFTEEEHKTLNLRMRDGGVAWEAEAETVKDIPIGDVAHRFVIKRLKELDAQKQITDEILDILDKFPEAENSQ